jgi:ABC-2 type transport system permease protein
MTATVSTLPAGHARFSGVLHSEWTKLRTARSVRWLLVALVVTTAALGAGLSASEATSVAHEPAVRKAAFDPASWSLATLGFTQVFFGISGVLAISGEYATGTIHSSLAAVPRRLRFLAAKLTLLGLAALVAGEAVTFAMFFGGQALLRSAGAPSTTLTQPGVARAVTATGVFLALLALFGAGCGVIFRRSAVSIAAYIVAAFLSFFVLGFSNLGKYTPELMLLNSVSAVRSNTAGGFLPPGGESVALLATYTAVLLAAGAALFARRDA